ncbi:MAG: hypothetical protein AB7E70_13025 [Hyphomicrobiaceae bacterium]
MASLHPGLSEDDWRRSLMARLAELDESPPRELPHASPAAGDVADAPPDWPAAGDDPPLEPAFEDVLSALEHSRKLHQIEAFRNTTEASARRASMTAWIAAGLGSGLIGALILALAINALPTEVRALPGAAGRLAALHAASPPAPGRLAIASRDEPAPPASPRASARVGDVAVTPVRLPEARPAPKPVPGSATLAPIFEIVLRPDRSHSARFPLSIQSGSTLYPLHLLMIRNLPEGITLSHGMRVAPGIWAVSPQELEALTLSLPATPLDRFDISVELLDSEDRPVAQSSFGVRVVSGHLVETSARLRLPPAPARTAKPAPHVAAVATPDETRAATPSETVRPPLTTLSPAPQAPPKQLRAPRRGVGPGDSHRARRLARKKGPVRATRSALGAPRSSEVEARKPPSTGILSARPLPRWAPFSFNGRD